MNQSTCRITQLGKKLIHYIMFGADKANWSQKMIRQTCSGNFTSAVFTRA